MKAHAHRIGLKVQRDDAVYRLKVLPPSKSRSSSFSPGIYLILRGFAGANGLRLLLGGFLLLVGAASAQAQKGSARFQLVEGKGVAVCEANLIRLNEGSYAEHPVCDRPAGDPRAGFAMLRRLELKHEQVQPFWASMRSFLIDGDPDLWRRHEDWLKERGMPPRIGDREKQLQAMRGETELHVYRFDPPIDIDNDGVADPVLLWQDGHCGDADSLTPRTRIQIPFLPNSTGDGPDVDATRRLFGNPAGYLLPSGKPLPRFRPIGTRIGLFRFQDLYYLDAFFDEWGDFNDQRRTDPDIRNRLGVFLVREGKTKQVCEYRLARAGQGKK